MPRSLILCPTRELAAQVSENIEIYGKYHKLSMALLIGGVNFKDQDKLIDRGVDVLIATPGRLLDHFERGKLMLTGVQVMEITVEFTGKEPNDTANLFVRSVFDHLVLGPWADDEIGGDVFETILEHRRIPEEVAGGGLDGDLFFFDVEMRKCGFGAGDIGHVKPP